MAAVLQKTQSYGYDLLGRVKRVSNADGTFTEYGYDPLGNQASTLNPRGFVTTRSFDSLNRLTEVVQPGNVTTTYTYNSQDRVTSVTDANGNLTTYSYDDMGRVYQEVSPDSGTTAYAYDAAGNVRFKTDGRGVTVEYIYDALSRLTQINYPTDPDVTYDYDAATGCANGKGRLCRVVDQAGTTTYSYSPKGELVEESKVIQGVTYVTGYTYDANGNVATITYPTGRVVTYTYDTTDRVSLVTTTQGTTQTVVSAVTYKPFGGMSSFTYGNGLPRTISYDPDYRLTGIQTGTGAGAVQSLTYTPDPNGNVTSIENALDPSKDKTYTYDALDRLEGATGPWGSLGWTYDDVGNRKTQSAAEGNSTYAYQVGTNRLVSVGGPDPHTFGYDDAGNMTSQDSRTYTYNENGRLVNATEGATLGDYTYDSDEHRAIKAAGGATAVFHYRMNGELIAETEGAGAVIAEYVYLYSEPIAKVEADGTLHYVQVDHLGTPLLMTDGTGAVVWEVEARPFGDGATIAGTASLNLRFPGQYLDGETGLHQNWWRSYEPRVGYYTRPDPAGPHVGGGAYLYARAAPTTYRDYTGLQPYFIPPGAPTPPMDEPPKGCRPNGPWTILREGTYTDRGDRIFSLEKEEPIHIVSPHGRRMSFHCNCWFRLTAEEQIDRTYRKWERWLLCDTCDREVACCVEPPVPRPQSGSTRTSRTWLKPIIGGRKSAEYSARLYVWEGAQEVLRWRTRQ